MPNYMPLVLIAAATGAALLALFYTILCLVFRLLDRREYRRYLRETLESARYEAYITSWTHEEIAPGLFHPVRPDNYRGVR